MNRVTLTGSIERSPMGGDTWSLVTPDGTYEIYQGAPADLLQPGLNVTVDGRIRDDVMSIAMIGPIVEVISFEINKN